MAIIKKVIIHCADTPADMDVGVDEIRRWHVEERGWSDVGYHWVIRRDGSVEKGRDESVTGAHVRGHNTGSIGICLLGGAGGECNFSSAQWSALDTLVTNILARYRLTGADVYGHRDFDKGKQCPTFDAKAWASSL
jgi:N-acetylmuramoyl-L-alanine amidase